MDFIRSKVRINTALCTGNSKRTEGAETEERKQHETLKNSIKIIKFYGNCFGKKGQNKQRYGSTYTIKKQ